MKNNIHILNQKVNTSKISCAGPLTMSSITVNNSTLNIYDKFMPGITLHDESDIQLTDSSDTLTNRLVRIEQILGIVTRDRVLENKYHALKAAGDEYEAEILAVHNELKETISTLTDKYSSLLEEYKVLDKLSENL